MEGTRKEPTSAGMSCSMSPSCRTPMTALLSHSEGYTIPSPKTPLGQGSGGCQCCLYVANTCLAGSSDLSTQK